MGYPSYPHGNRRTVCKNMNLIPAEDKLLINRSKTDCLALFPGYTDRQWTRLIAT
jgi:hypothetical protein